MNTVVLIGRPTGEPQMAYTPSQMAIAKFTLAVDRPKTKDKEDGTDFIRIACKGRAAKIHLIICTQRPTREIIDGSIRACLPCVLALRCSSAQESRNLIDRKGAEDLPLHGTGLYLTPSSKDIEEVPVPMVEESEMQALIDWWVKQA